MALSPQMIEAMNKATGFNVPPDGNNVVHRADEIRAIAQKAQIEKQKAEQPGLIGSLVSAPLTMLARPVQAVAELAGVPDETVNKVSHDISGGLIAPTPQNYGDVTKDIGRGAQTIALGMGPVSGSAAYFAGQSAAEGEKDPLKIGEQAAYGAVFGKVAKVIGTPIFNAAGKVVGKVTPQYLQDLVAQGGQKLTDFAAAHEIMPEAISSFVNKGADALESAANKPFDMVGNALSTAGKSTLNALKGYADDAARTSVQNDVKNLLSSTKGISNRNQLAQTTGTDLQEHLSDPAVYRGIQVENGRVNPDEAVAVVEHRIDSVLDAKSQMLPELDRVTPEIPKETLRERALANIQGKYTPADEKAMVDAIDSQLAAVPDTLKVSQVDKLRAQFRASARNAKGLQKSSSEYAALENAARDTVFDVTDKLPISGSEDYKALNDYVKQMITTKDFLDKTLRGQVVKGARLSKYVARTIGAVAGVSHGALGALGGAEAMGAIADVITNSQLGNSMKMNLIRNMTDDPAILQKVEDLLGEIKALNLPLLKSGETAVPTTYGASPIALPEKSASTLESQERLNPNISRQNTANSTISNAPSPISTNIPEDLPKVKGGVPDTQDLLSEARKYKTPEEFRQNYDGGVLINRDAMNSFISRGPGGYGKVSELLTPEGKSLMKEMGLPDLPINIVEDSEDVGFTANIRWSNQKKGGGLPSAEIDLTISPFEEEGVQDLLGKEYDILHELAHAQQLKLGRAPVRDVPSLEVNADKNATYRYKKLITDFWKKAHSEMPSIGQQKITNGADFVRAKNLTPELRAIETKAFDKILSNEDSLLAAYKDKYGKIVNADNFRPLFTEEGYNGQNSEAIQEAVSYLAKRARTEALANPGEYVVGTAGGSGAGKTAAGDGIPDVKGLTDKAAMVLDSNFSSLDSAHKFIDEVQKRGKKFIGVFTYRDALDALENGIIKRTLTNPSEMGRIVPDSVSSANHIDSFDVVKQLVREGHKFIFVDNSLGKGRAKIVSLADLETKVKYPPKGELKAKFDAKVKELYENQTPFTDSEGKVHTLTREQYESLIR